jgi:hypothetical protein
MHENWKKFDRGIVFSNTQFSADNFDYIDKCFLHAKYDEFTLANLKLIHEQFVDDRGKILDCALPRENSQISNEIQDKNLIIP